MSTEISTDLKPADRARQILKFDERKTELAAMAKDSERITAITNKDGLAECHSARMKLKNTRVAIEKVGKEARADATAFSKAVIAAEAELVGLIAPEEDRLQAVQDEWEAKIAAEKAAKEEAERQRLAAIRARINAIKDAPRLAMGKTVAEIGESMEAIAAADFSDLDDMLQVEAKVAAEAATKALAKMLVDMAAAAAEAQRIAAERAELERQRAELAERERIAAQERAEADRLAQIERDRLAAEAKAQADAEAAERRAQQEREDEERRVAEAELRAQREREEAELAASRAEQARLDAEHRAAQEAAFKAEQDRQRQEMQRQQDELRRQQEVIAEERRQREQAEREAREAREAKDRAEAQAKAEEAAKIEAEARERDIREATLVSAATEALRMLRDMGHGDCLVTLKLAAALEREGCA